MNREKSFIVFVLMFFVGLFAVAQYNTGVYREQGGNRMVVASGGSLDIESGGEIDVESGGALKLAGVSIAGTADGLNVKRIARATLDCATETCSGAVGLGVSLPAKALITKSFFYVGTQFVDSGSGTLAFSCEDANNLFSAADVTGHSAGAIVSGAVTGLAGTMVAAIAAECEITATIATAEQTAGEANLFVEYVVHD